MDSRKWLPLFALLFVGLLLLVVSVLGQASTNAAEALQYGYLPAIWGETGSQGGEATATPTVQLPATSPTATATGSPTDDVSATHTPTTTSTATATATPSITPDPSTVSYSQLVGNWEFYGAANTKTFACLKWNLCSDGSYVQFFSNGTLFIYKYYVPENGGPIVERSQTGNWSVSGGILDVRFADGIHETHKLSWLIKPSQLLAEAREVSRASYLNRVGQPPPTVTPTANPSPTATPKKPRYQCSFEVLYDGLRNYEAEVTLLNNGNLLTVGGFDFFGSLESYKEGYVFTPADRKFRQVGSIHDDRVLDEGILLNDGRVLVPASPNAAEIYDPQSEKFTPTNTFVGCTHPYRIFYDGTILGVCGVGTAIVYDPYLDQIVKQTDETWLYYFNDVRAVPVGNYGYQTLITDGASGVILEAGGPEITATTVFKDLGYNNDDATVGVSFDKRYYFITGGGAWSDPYTPFIDNKVEVVDLEKGQRKEIAPMNVGRIGHTLTALPDGNMLVIGGSGQGPDYLSSVEIFDAEAGAFVLAGNLNIGRYRHTTVRLLNGEIFVYGGETTPGPGYSYVPPPEIGKCEKVN